MAFLFVILKTLAIYRDKDKCIYIHSAAAANITVVQTEADGQGFGQARTTKLPDHEYYPDLRMTHPIILGKNHDGK